MSASNISPLDPGRRRAAPPLSCLSSSSGVRGRVTVSGELDITGVPQLDGALRAAEQDAETVVLDLRRAEFIDFSAAQLMLATDRRLREAGRRLLVVRAPAEIQLYLTLTGMDRELTLIDRAPAATGAA